MLYGQLMKDVVCHQLLLLSLIFPRVSSASSRDGEMDRASAILDGAILPAINRTSGLYKASWNVGYERHPDVLALNCKVHVRGSFTPINNCLRSRCY